MTDRAVMQQALDALEAKGDAWIVLERKAITALREALAEQSAQQEPVAFYVYKPTLPRGNLGLVADGNLPWVYDQDPSSGFSARMMVTPVTSPPARHKPLTDEQVWLDDELMKLNAVMMLPMDYFMRVIRAIEAAHGIKENT